MNLDPSCYRADNVFALLMQKHSIAQVVSRQLQKKLPRNLISHYKVVSVSCGSMLIATDNAIVASRLKMLLPSLLPYLQDFQIDDYQIYIDNRNEEIVKNPFVDYDIPVITDEMRKTANEIVSRMKNNGQDDLARTWEKWKTE